MINSMINFMSELVRYTINFLLIAVVLKVLINIAMFGSPLSRRRMMYNMTKMKVHKQGGFNEKQKPKEYYEYKVWKAERRNAMLKKVTLEAYKYSKPAISKIAKKVTKKKANVNKVEKGNLYYMLDKKLLKSE